MVKETKNDLRSLIQPTSTSNTPDSPSSSSDSCIEMEQIILLEDEDEHEHEQEYKIKDDDLRKLLDNLKLGNEEEFIEQYSSYAPNELKFKETMILLVWAVHKPELRKAFDTILKNFICINNAIQKRDTETLKLCEGIIIIACYAENWNALKKLLKNEYLKCCRKEELLFFIVKDVLFHFNLEDTLTSKCLDNIIYSKEININKLDDKGNSLIDYAIWNGDDIVVEKLLKAGIYIGKPYLQKDSLIIDEINKEILEESFNECVKSNQIKPSDKCFKILFNYKNIIPPIDSKYLENEMNPIMAIVKSKSLLPLLKHPLIRSFLFLKWTQIARIFYLNFIFYSLFCLSMVSHIILKCISKHPLIIELTFWLNVFGIAYLIIREIIQLILDIHIYFRKLCNYLEITLICLSITTITMSIDSSGEKAIVVFTILTMACEFSILVGYLPVLSISTHMLMLQEVLRTFLKSFLLYSVFILTFALCFFVLIGKKVRGNVKSEGNPQERNVTNCESDDAPTQMFSNILTSTIKVMAMFIGELDLENLGLSTSYSYILFLLFIICMAIVLLNLLNGLAVSDTQTIKEQAELNALICRANAVKSFDFMKIFPFCKGANINYDEEEEKEEEEDKNENEDGNENGVKDEDKEEKKDTNKIIYEDELISSSCVCRTSIRVQPNADSQNKIIYFEVSKCKICCPIRDAQNGSEDDPKPESNCELKPEPKPEPEPKKKMNEQKNAFLNLEVVRQFLECLRLRSSVMESSTVRAAIDILAKQNLKKKEKIELKNTEKKLENHENQLRNIEQNLRTIGEDVKKIFELLKP